MAAGRPAAATRPAPGRARTSSCRTGRGRTRAVAVEVVVVVGDEEAAGCRYSENEKTQTRHETELVVNQETYLLQGVVELALISVGRRTAGSEYVGIVEHARHRRAQGCDKMTLLVQGPETVAGIRHIGKAIDQYKRLGRIIVMADIQLAETRAQCGEDRRGPGTLPRASVCVDFSQDLL